MDIPNNHEIPRRITRNNYNPDALRRMLRPSNGNGLFRRLSRTTGEGFGLICQVVKYLILSILGLAAMYYGGKILLLILIGIQDKL